MLSKTKDMNIPLKLVDLIGTGKTMKKSILMDDNSEDENIKASREVITPEIAHYYLENQANNRTINPSYVKRLAQDMIDGRWVSDGDPIKFSDDDILIDGQHRCSAVIESKTPQTFIVLRGYKKESMQVLDLGKQRSSAHVGQIMGLDINNHHTACINALSLPCDDSMLSVTKILEVFNTYKEAILFSCQYIPNTVVNPIAPMRALLAKAYYYEDRSRLEEFLRIYATGHVKHASEDTAAIALRNSWQKMKENDTATMTYARRIDWYLKCQLALSHFLKGRDIKNLQKTKAVFDHYPLPGIQKETADVIKRLKHFNR